MVSEVNVGAVMMRFAIEVIALVDAWMVKIGSVPEVIAALSKWAS